MGTVILVVLFFLIYTFVSFVIAYSSDTAETANDDFGNLREPSILDLSEEERTCYSMVDGYIKNTILPRRDYQILHHEIYHFQKDADSVFLCMVIISMFLSGILLKKLGIENWFVWCFTELVAMIIGYIYTSVVKIIYKKYSTLRINSYYKNNPTYAWETHYRHLLTYKDNVIYRYTLRKIIGVLTLLFIIVVIYSNLG